MFSPGPGGGRWIRTEMSLTDAKNARVSLFCVMILSGYYIYIIKLWFSIGQFPKTCLSTINTSSNSAIYFVHPTNIRHASHWGHRFGLCFSRRGICILKESRGKWDHSPCLFIEHSLCPRPSDNSSKWISWVSDQQYPRRSASWESTPFHQGREWGRESRLRVTQLSGDS